MVSPWGESCFLLISFFYSARYVSTQDITLTIPLNGTITYDNRELYHDYRNLNDSIRYLINFDNINPNLKFILLQVHSHIENVTLFQNYDKRDNRVIGTNIGLVSLQPAKDIFYLKNSDENVDHRVYISVHGYHEYDPIPGGCNGEWDVNISPFLKVTTTKELIVVDAQDGSVDDSCIQALMTNVTFYMMYLPELNFYPDVYFEGIRKMMTLKGITEEGTIIPGFHPRMINRRRLSTYPGTGAIYVAVARNIYNHSNYSVYVPAHSYGCFLSDLDGCEIIDDALSQILCAVLFFLGVFICFFGHRFFKTEMFLFGFLAGVLISYISLALITSMERSALVAASSISGIFFGATWLLFWWLYGIPVISVLLPSMQLGFLLSAIFYYRLPTETMYLEDDFNFWSLFCLVMCLTALALLSVTYAANILCCAVLGAYACVHALDYYLGSSLKFIIINTIRRAVVANFNFAVLMPPFQWRDMLVTFTWVVLAILGFCVQHWHNRGRPPFPPPPRNTRPTIMEPYMYSTIVDYTRGSDPISNTAIARNSANERTPLLG